MTTNDLVIETQSLTKRYGKILAVDQLTMEVPRGHIFGLLGPNGSGKTTTMGMLLGLVKPTSGTFNLLGASTAASGSSPSHRRDSRNPIVLPVSIGPQQPRLLPGDSQDEATRES